MVKNTRMGRAMILSAGLGLGAISVLMSGCVSYTNVPVPESAPAFKSMNHGQSITVVSRALSAVIADHPVRDGDGHYAINLPIGTTPSSADKILAALPVGAIVPFEGMDSSVPTYSIGRIWIRASDAKVDVVYPFVGINGIHHDQSVTVWLNGGVRKWRVNRQQHWAPGTIETPPIYVPISGDEQADEDSATESPTESVARSNDEPQKTPTSYSEIPADD